MASPEVDAVKLGDILMAVRPEALSMMYRDAFAAGCYLLLKGQRTAGLKLCNQVLKSVGDHRRQTYFNQLIANLPGNERLFAGQVAAHHEISRDLFGEGSRDE